MLWQSTELLTTNIVLAHRTFSSNSVLQKAVMYVVIILRRVSCSLHRCQYHTNSIPKRCTVGGNVQIYTKVLMVRVQRTVR